MVFFKFLWGIAEIPRGWLGIPNIFGLEGNSTIGSLLPVGQSPITDWPSSKTGTCISNSRIGFRVIMTFFWHFLLSQWIMCIKPLNDTFETIFSYLQAEICMLLKNHYEKNDSFYK